MAAPVSVVEGMLRVTVFYACDCCGKQRAPDPDEMLCEACWPESRRIRKRLAEIEALRDATLWAAGRSARYRPLDGSIFEERIALRDRLQELQHV